MADTAFIVRVPEAEAHVTALRQRFDRSVQLGVPAHVTVLAPFMAPERIDSAVLQRIRATLCDGPAFAFSLHRVARFPATAYLAPEPALGFIEMTRALVRQFPEFPPFGGLHDSIVPHLTVAHGDALEAESAASELQAVMDAKGAITATCRSVSLLENSTGRWRSLHEFVLRDLSAAP